MVRRPRQLPGRLRPGRPSDEPEVRRLADEVFSVYGEYGSWLPGYLSHPGVWTFVYEEDRQLAGFAMLGVLEPERRGGPRIGDLLAIAVWPPCHGRGIGTLLLDRVREKGYELQRILGIEEIRLTVADTNKRAQALFSRVGFVPIPGDHGFYDKGQVALRLCLRL